MAADRLTQAVRHRLGLGRLLPLGPAEDGCWIAEQAAAGLLRRSVAGVPGLRVAALRIDAGAAAEPVHSPVPAPPSALPHGPVRLAAECALVPDAVLPGAADELRTALAGAAAGRLGLLVEAVDLHVTALLGGAADPVGHDVTSPAHPAAQAVAGGSGLPGCAARAAEAVPGVLGLAPVLGGPAPTVYESDSGHHVQVELAVAENRRTLDVARAAREAVRHAVTAETGDRPVTVAVLVTAVGTD